MGHMKGRSGTGGEFRMRGKGGGKEKEGGEMLRRYCVTINIELY